MHAPLARSLNHRLASRWLRLRRVPASAAPAHPCAFLPMPSNPHKHRSRAIYDSFTRRCAEQVSEDVLETAEQSQCLSPGAELAPHLVRHNWCVTTAANDFAIRNTRGTRRAAAPVVAAARSTRPRASCCKCACAPSLWLCCTVTVAVLGGLVCAQSRRALFARDGSSERIHILRRRR